MLAEEALQNHLRESHSSSNRNSCWSKCWSVCRVAYSWPSTVCRSSGPCFPMCVISPGERPIGTTPKESAKARSRQWLVCHMSSSQSRICHGMKLLSRKARLARWSPESDGSSLHLCHHMIRSCPNRPTGKLNRSQLQLILKIHCHKYWHRNLSRPTPRLNCTKTWSCTVAAHLQTGIVYRSCQATKLPSNNAAARVGSSPTWLSLRRLGPKTKLYR